MELNEYLSASHKKRKKRRRHIFAAIMVGIVGLAITLCLWAVIRSPLFVISRFVIEGNHTTSSSDIMALADSAYHRESPALWLGMSNMLAWPTSFASSDIFFAPQLSSLSIHKDYLARTITIAATERQPFAIWCFLPSPAGGLAEEGQPSADFSSASVANESCYWFDTSGHLFAPAFDAQGDLISTVHDYSQANPGLGGQILPDRFVLNLVSAINVLQASGLRIEEIRLNDLGLEEIQVHTFNGPDIYFSLRFPADDTLSVLQSLMAKPGFSKLQYVDFRTEDRAYYE